MRRRVRWRSEDHCTVGGLTFQILRSGQGDPSPEGDADFLLLKERPLVERYVDLLAEVDPRNVFELGIFAGGSTAFLYEVGRPRRLVAIDRDPPVNDALERHLARSRAGEAVRLHHGVDQGDRDRLDAIVASDFGGERLDLVVDDCSHRYGPTLASFNELFPRLRPGGAYLIEDWPWAHRALGSLEAGEVWADETPLTVLLFELTLALAAVPELVAQVLIDPWCVVVRRGEADADPRGFDLAAHLDKRGRDLLASG